MYNPEKPYKKQILELIQQTWNTPYVSVKDNIIERKVSYPDIDHTDGIGTKGIYHWQKQTFNNAVLDVLAMNLNDLAVMRAVPYKLSNHITVPEEDERVLKIIDFLSKECKKRNIAIVGGEVSFHNNVDGMDISATVSGFIKNLKENKFEVGDFLLGFKSNGLHSNGFSKVREVFGKEYRPEFVEPTNIYSDIILALNEKFDIHGMVHITGGAYTKIKDLLNNTDAYLRRNHKLQPHQIFKDIYQRGVPDEEMYKTFNCGVGFILSVKPEEVKRIISETKNFESDIIGEILPGNGNVKIESVFSNKEIIL